MKKKAVFIMLLGSAILLSACQTNSVNHEKITTDVSADESSEALSETGMTPTGFAADDSYVSEPVTFVWEDVGFGGDFVITLEPYNMFQLYEGPLSSTIYRGYFDVDGDVVTLRDSATSEEFKNFRFRINDDKTELTFIADGSDNRPFCRLEDGALCSTEIHHDISEYWESEAKHDNSEESDVVPAVMVNGALYFSTGQESTVSGRCGNMFCTYLGTILSAGIKANRTISGGGGQRISLFLIYPISIGNYWIGQNKHMNLQKRLIICRRMKSGKS